MDTLTTESEVSSLVTTGSPSELYDPFLLDPQVKTQPCVLPSAPPPTIKIAVIADIHLGDDTQKNLGSQACSLLERFVAAANAEDVDLVIDLGDRISVHSPQEDLRNAQHVMARLAWLNADTYHLMGTHDLRNLSRQDHQQLLYSPATNFSFDHKGYHFCFFNPGGDDPHALGVTGEDLKWFWHDLEDADKPTIVFSHIPLDFTRQDPDAAENSLTDTFGDFGFPRTGASLQRMITSSRKVILSVSGHTHMPFDKKIHETRFIDQDSFTRASGRADQAEGRYGVITLTGRDVNYRMRKLTV